MAAEPYEEAVTLGEDDVGRCHAFAVESFECRIAGLGGINSIAVADQKKLEQFAAQHVVVYHEDAKLALHVGKG